MKRRLMNCWDLKPNHLAYIPPRWYGNQISGDCQQKLLSGDFGRFSQVTFLEEQER